MAFFGLPERNLPIGSLGEHHEKIVEYTWGEENYDGLGDALQEARDDLNDETFGSMGPVGMRQHSFIRYRFKHYQGKILTFQTLCCRMSMTNSCQSIICKMFIMGNRWGERKHSRLV